MLDLYRRLTDSAAPALRWLLERRVRAGKELPDRLSERYGIPSQPRPQAPLVWLHAASVGEAQSVLALITTLQRFRPDLWFLVTTGTVTSAQLMAKRLPAQAIHQFIPLDHAPWVRAFLDHWHPDIAIWVESELWPNLIRETSDRRIPLTLLNARMSRKSLRRWGYMKKAAHDLLSRFNLLMAQTTEDAHAFRRLGADSIVVTGNLKYAADPLPATQDDMDALLKSAGHRPRWLYASSHADEERLAGRIHQALKKKVPGLLTIIVPRHPERRGAIAEALRADGLNPRFRGEDKAMPQPDDEIYVADTLGELGLFYAFSPISCIGRSFSSDGGGGHNPIEAAQLGSAVLHGPLIQNLTAIYREMDSADAAIGLQTETALRDQIFRFLSDPATLDAQRRRGYEFVSRKAGVLEIILTELAPLFARAEIHLDAPGPHPASM